MIPLSRLRFYTIFILCILSFCFHSTLPHLVFSAATLLLADFSDCIEPLVHHLSFSFFYLGRVYALLCHVAREAWYL